MKKTSIGFAMTGSFCTFERVLKQMEALVRRGYEVVPVLSFNAGMLDTRFMTAEHLRARIVEITGNEPIDTLAGAEPIGPKKMTDVFLIAPATGNSLAKLAAGIYDTPVLLGPRATCAMTGLWCWPYPPMTGWARRRRISAASSTCAIFTLCPSVRMTR